MRRWEILNFRANYCRASKSLSSASVVWGIILCIKSGREASFKMALEGGGTATGIRIIFLIGLATGQPLIYSSKHLKTPMLMFFEFRSVLNEPQNPWCTPPALSAHVFCFASICPNRIRQDSKIESRETSTNRIKPLINLDVLQPEHFVNP